jgi:ABC-type transporter Mla subunit MlaD
VILVDKPRLHRNVWIGMAVIAAVLLVGLMVAYAGGGSAGTGGY